MGMLSREDILNYDDIKTETVEVPEWGGSVCVKTMTGTERDSFEASMMEGKGKSTTMNMNNLRAKLVSKTAIDPDTKELLFTAGDIDALGLKSAAALDRVFTVAQRLSKITDTDVEDLTKN